MNKKDILNKIKSLEGLDNNEKAYLVNLVNTTKKYGLVWEDKPEDVEEELRTKLPILKEVKERAIINDTETEKHPNHILIEGDNLHALTALTFTHEEKIDVIYIDPPYNTGNKDFKYNDIFVDREDSYRHSKWLSFMDKRLRIAKRLLSDNGVVFISIDENECYQLKLLCDEIFIDSNFIADNIWKSKSGGAGDASFIATDTENILVYAKNKSNLNLGNDNEATVTTSYNRVEPDGRRYSLDRLDKQSLGYQETLDFPIKSPSGEIYIVEHKDPNNKVARWRWGKNTVSERLDELVFENGYVYTKNYEKDDGAKPRNLLTEERFGRTRTGKTELFSIIGSNNMTAPKPSRLIQYLLNLFPQNDFTFLDFFAGSGTSLDALMKLNSIDQGTRKGIICTNNEDDICHDITYPRITNIIKGFKSKGNNQVEIFNDKLTLSSLKNSKKLLDKIEGLKKKNETKFSKLKIELKDNNITLWGLLEKGNNIQGLRDNNLRYYQCDFVERTPSLKNKKQLTLLATELLCIKENCYNEITSSLLKASWHKLFTNGSNNFVYVIYDDYYIEDAIETLTAFINNQPDEITIKVYVFSNGQYAYAEEFESIAANITLAALPDAIYKAYQNVLPKEEKEFIPTLEEDLNTETAN